MTQAELKKLVFYLDGLKYSFQIINLASCRLRETLDEIARNHPDKYTEEQVTSGLLDAWTLIDACHRVRGLVQGMPRLSRKLPGIQVFLRETKQIEDLRDYVQHFRSGIHKIPSQSNPLWGVLSWTPTDNQTASYTIFSGNLVGGVYGHSLVFDRNITKFPTGIKLVANDIEVDVLCLAEQLKKAKISISTWLDQLQQPKIKQVKGKTMVLSLQYQEFKSPVADV